MRNIATAIIGAIMAASGLFVLGAPGPVMAIGLCDCCSGTLNPSCQAACAGQSTAPGQCGAVIDYIGKGAASEDKNPLAGISLKDFSLGNPSAPQLESFRRFLEAGRRRAIAGYNRAAWRLQHGRISQETFDQANALYKDALVNYYRGMRAYLVKVGAKSD